MLMCEYRASLGGIWGCETYPHSRKEDNMKIYQVVEYSSDGDSYYDCVIGTFLDEGNAHKLKEERQKFYEAAFERAEKCLNCNFVEDCFLENECNDCDNYDVDDYYEMKWYKVKGYEVTE